MRLSFALGLMLLIAAPAFGQTRVMTAHDQSAPALMCLLEHKKNDCKYRFATRATRPAQFWLFWNPNRENAFGPLVSSEYAGTEQNIYTSKFLNGQTADVYDVKFQRQELTFYIVPPDSDGEVHYMNVRHGAPDDEKIYLFAAGPG